MSERISPQQFHEAEGVQDWQVLDEGACTYFRTGSFAAGARMVHAISELSGFEDHRPDIDLRYEGVTVRLITIAPGYNGLSQRVVELARQISAVARELNPAADPSAVQTVQVTIDALVLLAVMPFWRAVFGYQDHGDSSEDLVGRRSRSRAVVLVSADGRAAAAAQPGPHRRLGAARPG